MSRESLKIPSKTFLLGEYAVLTGGPALVLAHPPFFSLKKTNKPKLFHPKSPASLLMKKHGLRQDFDFLDPHRGGGGFGGSTAEVISSLKNRHDINIAELLADYKNLFTESGAEPSGADLCTQWLFTSEDLSGARLAVFKMKTEVSGEFCKGIEWPFKDISMMIFKRPKKAQTHTHLNSLNSSDIDFVKLRRISEEGLSFLERSDFRFFDSLNDFTKEQKKLSLLDENSFKEISKIRELPSVITARACGALGMDVVTVFCSLKEDLDKIKAKIVDFDFNYDLITTLGRGDFKSE